VASLYRLHDRGRLRVGHRADIVAVNHDLRPQLVIAGGRVLLTDGKPTVRGHFERRH
jgi:adenine deaminase